MSDRPDYYSDIQHHLDELGVRDGMHLIVHSGLRYIGGRAAQPQRLVQSLLDRLGERGCLLMPTFQNDRPLEEYMASDPLYDPRQTPSQTGGLTQILMTEHPSRRSYHPWLAVSALGQGMSDYVKEHHLSVKPHDERSPFYKLMQHPQGYILLLGVNQRNNASLYVLESIRYPDYPYKAFLDEPLTMRYLDYEGIEHKMQTLVPNRRYKPRLGQWGDDLHAQYPEIGRKLISPLGYEITLLHAATFLEYQTKALKRGMYHHNPYYAAHEPRWERAVVWVKRRLGIKRRLLPGGDDLKTS
ncbi:MAG: AAC(3) family N-acetyltransferase [Anaerolineales bacterium]